MQVANQALEPFVQDVGIDLRGRDVGMAEQCLHDAQVGAVMQKMACEGVAQHMGAHLFRAQPGADGNLLQFARRMLPRQMAVLAEGGKQPFRLGRPVMVLAPLDQRRPVVAHRGLGSAVERNQPFPAALAAHDQHLVVAPGRRGRQRDQLGDTATARSTYEDFLKRYPRSPRKREAQEALAELALLQNSEAPAAKSSPAENSAAAANSKEEPRAESSANSGGKSGGRSATSEIPRVRRIRAAANGEATRVTIDLENSVQYVSGRIANPDRIFFDLHAARLTPEVARGNIQVDGGLLTAVRVAQNHVGVVRVVLDVNGVKDYTASLTNNPTQLVIDLYGKPPAAVLNAKSKRGQQSSNSDENESPANAVPGTVQNAESKSGMQKPSPFPDPTAAGNSSAVAHNSSPTTKNAKSKSLKTTSASTKPDLVQPASAPQPTRAGQSTLTRALGLKVGRIVIDAGHGGHDTGTIGPTGLMEKDLCLDVALRLGKIIEQRLPGADVVYTRSDDTFIPLEERTNIANQAKADLFISIHANSSQDHAARGIETYYLNLKGSAEAMEVAARENATAQEGVHDLQDLVKKIAQTEKIEESKEFAEDIQDSLSKRIPKPGKMKNRGVRKAPFVVLIGADMPSILTEISFLSNPADEQLLKKPEQRQRVAEGLYQGVASYLQAINSVTVNLPAKPGTARPSPAVAVEQSRNQK